MIPDAAIISAYAEEEQAAGGQFKADPLHVVDRVSSRLGVEKSRVRDVMRAHWTGQGAG